jgi:menaquinone-dependent protoporphyrinogen oxidase
MRTIIIYSTKYGSAGNAAKMLEAKMDGEVQVVNIMTEVVPSLVDYDNIILGGSIYIGKIQRKLSKFVDKNLPILMKKRIGLFICAAEKEEVRTKELESAFPAELYYHAICKEIFGYEIHYDKLNFLEKKMAGTVLGHKHNHSELSEEKIKKFARALQ